MALSHRSLLFALVSCLGSAPGTAQQTQIADSTLDVGGAHLRYRVGGHGAPVVLIHGFAGNANDLAAVRSALSSSHMTVSVEIRGFGQTSGPLSAAGADTAIVEDIARVMAHLRIERADVVGFSMGAVLAARLAVLHPSRVHSLVLVSAAPMLMGPAHAFWDPVADDLEHGRGIATLVRATTPIGTALPDDSTVARASRQSIGTHETGAWAAIARGMPGLALSPTELRRLTTRVLIVYGANDPLMRAHGEWANELPNAQIDTVANANHASTRLAPEFLRMTERFVDSRGAP